MKTKRFLGLELKFQFSLKRVKRIYVPIPDWADDTHLTRFDYEERKLMPQKVCYWKQATPFYIEIPKCKEAVQVSVSNLYNKDRTAYEKNREIVIDLYL